MIKIYDNGVDYYVVIGEDVYEMNNYANRPNGVNLYVGNVESFRLDGKLVAEISERMLKAIYRRIIE